MVVIGTTATPGFGMPPLPSPPCYKIGFTDEAGQFMNWIHKCCTNLNEDGSLQIMYGIDGRKYLPETELDHFDGYMGSRPVRIGNEAANQLQLDIYGELMDAVYRYDETGAYPLPTTCGFICGD